MTRNLLLSGLLVAACAAAQQTTTTANVNQTDQQFVQKAAQINMGETHLGKLAQEKAANQEIRTFGEQLQRDHTQAYERLTKIANDKNISIPKSIDAEHQNTISKFENLSGEAFDREFRQHQVQDHQKAIEFFRNYSQQGQDPDLKSYASELLPTLESHLQRAQNFGQGTTTAAAAPAPSEQQPAGTATATPPSSEADRDRSPQAATTAHAHPEPGTTAAAQSLHSNVHHGTVTRYQRGRTIEMKMRDRFGRHVYDLGESGLTVEIPEAIKTGATVKVTEMVDPNGLRTLRIELDDQSADRLPQGRDR